MALQIGPYVVQRGAILPYEDETKSGQQSDVDGDGNVIVHDLPYQERFLRMHIRCTRAEGKCIEGFLTNGVRFKRIPFVVIDGFGVTRTVRFWDNSVRRTYAAGDTVELDLLLREEVEAV